MADSMSKRNRERRKREKKMQKESRRSERQEQKDQNGGTLPEPEEPMSAADLFEELARVGDEDSGEETEEDPQ